VPQQVWVEVQTTRNAHSSIHQVTLLVVIGTIISTSFKVRDDTRTTTTRTTEGVDPEGSAQVAKVTKF
jgi:hypothetical protein